MEEALIFWERQFHPTSAIKIAGPDLIAFHRPRISSI
jgi:hypothetical protein